MKGDNEREGVYQYYSSEQCCGAFTFTFTRIQTGSSWFDVFGQNLIYEPIIKYPFW